MLQCQKEERRNYHVFYQKQLRSLFFKCLQKEFRSKGVIEVVVYYLKKNNKIEIRRRILIILQ